MEMLVELYFAESDESFTEYLEAILNFRQYCNKSRKLTEVENESVMSLYDNYYRKELTFRRTLKARAVEHGILSIATLDCDPAT